MVEITKQQFDDLSAERDSLRRRLDEAKDMESVRVRDMERLSADLVKSQQEAQQIKAQNSILDEQKARLEGYRDGLKDAMEIFKDAAVEAIQKLAEEIRYGK